MIAHDIHDFVISSQKGIEEEYARIRKRAQEDPGTAGDQGEENWATLLRGWLPSYFQVVTKGRIITESGWVSPQLDVLVLFPSYPKILLDKKLFLSGGVAAAFECKTTLLAKHVKKAVENSAEIRRNLPKRQGTPFKELNSPIIFGLLAHSYSWKNKKSSPVKNVTEALRKGDKEVVKHPIECIDFVTVADLATWTISKMTYLSPKFPSYADTLAQVYGPDGSAATAYICHAKSQNKQSAKWEENQREYFSPLGVLLSCLYSKLAWTFPDMRQLEEYFRKADLLGRGSGGMRLWRIGIYSEAIRERVYKGHLSNGIAFDEWSIGF